MIKDFLSKVQEKPYETRVKILWMTVAIFSVVLIYLMVQSVQNSISNANGNLVHVQTGGSVIIESDIEFAQVERVERSEHTLKIYFNLNNPTDDILNVSKISDITLNTDKNTLTAQTITNRQGSDFVKKILSHTQTFGILTFPATEATNATLILNKMFLEKKPTEIFGQKLELDLEKLNKPSDVRQ
jgi:hypothetical protein